MQALKPIIGKPFRQPRVPFQKPRQTPKPALLCALLQKAAPGLGILTPFAETH